MAAKRYRYELPAFVARKYRRNCFTCGRTLTKHNYTREHLIPQWMIEAFELSEETVTLRSNLSLRYLDYLTPCCRACNCGLLSRIEKSLKRDLLSVARDGDDLLGDYAVWASKIIAGALFYERVLDGDPPREGRFPKKFDAIPMPISPRQMIEDHFRALRGDCRIDSLSGATPFSMFVFQAKVPQPRRWMFDLQVYPYLQAFYMRLRHRALLCRVDGGYLARHTDRFFAPFLEHALAPLQCEELAARFFAKAERQHVSPKVVREWHGKVETIQYYDLPVHEAFDPVTLDDLVGWLAKCTRSPEGVWRRDGGPTTYTRDENGAVRDLGVDARPVPPDYSKASPTSR